MESNFPALPQGGASINFAALPQGGASISKPLVTEVCCLLQSFFSHNTLDVQLLTTCTK